MIDKFYSWLLSQERHVVLRWLFVFIIVIDSLVAYGLYKLIIVGL